MYIDTLKNIMHEIYSITEKEMLIINEEKLILFHTNIKNLEYIKKEIENNFKISSKEGKFCSYYYKFLEFDKFEKFFILLKGKDENTLIQLRVIENLLSKINIKDNAKKTEEKKLFIKNVLLEKIIEQEEIENKAENYNLNIYKNNLVILISSNDKIPSLVETYLNEILNNENYIVIEIDDYEIVILKNIEENENKEESLIFLNNLLKDLKIKFTSDFDCAVGGLAFSLIEISKSLREAKIALQIRKIFNLSCTIIRYDKLGTERLIYRLPVSICKIFMNEILKKKDIKSLDKETLSTIDKFFENSLNISETSRKLFIHRNTLVYRLEKIKNLTGLDLRVFEDATKFKLALMIQKYLDFMLKNK